MAITPRKQFKKSIAPFMITKRKSESRPSKPLKKAIKRIIDKSKELKFYRFGSSETVYNAFNATNVWENYANGAGSLTNIAQGDTQSARDGDIVNLKYINCKLNVCVPASSSTLANAADQTNNYAVRFLLVQAKRGYSSTAILAILNTTLTAGVDTILKQDHDLNQACYILKDKTIVFRPDAATLSDGTNVIKRAQSMMVNMSSKPQADTIEWSSDQVTATPPNIRGGVFLLGYYTETDPNASVTIVGPPQYKASWDVKYREK